MEKERLVIGLSVLFLIFGVFLLIDSQTSITGAVIGVSDVSSTISSVFGIIFVLVSVVLLVEYHGTHGYTLEQIIDGKTSNNFKRSAKFLGRKHLEKGKGSLPANCMSEEHKERTYKELFGVLELERHQRFNPGLAGLKNMQMRYHRHEVSLRGLGVDEAITYDARVLAEGHRGVYRYVFDKNTGKYVGLARHVQGQGPYHYEWV